MFKEPDTYQQKWVAENFARAKRERGLTQSKLGVALGISQPQARALVLGDRKLKADEIPILEQLFNAEYHPNSDSNSSQFVPLVSWVSAGQMSEQSPVVNFDEYPPIETAGLHKGNWIALRVTGDSMNKISPPDSIIFVDLDDRNLVPNALYVISDEEGHATYKRYRPSESPPFQPASYHEVGPPCIKGAAKVIGRVRRSVIDC
ncbi:SOS-response transcriptional repressor LexA [Maritalea mobilis]|uniref:SOS-response transcriptional repressor LexA n=2 Tax=Maritalea mobilis TaxID=483324 RepID=A0A4R6VTU7_9HYPH|nr:SOS-response transcriptional repressor LexA [Maritalea mobilis]